jgi:Fe2+ or Zn2+ uptake regulation protein
MGRNPDRRANHVVFDVPHPGHAAMVCRHCGTVYHVKLPIDVKKFTKLSVAFVELHYTCEPKVDMPGQAKLPGTE